jgi:hypothetical protein
MTSSRLGSIHLSALSDTQCGLTSAFSNLRSIRLASFRSLPFISLPSRTGRAVGPCRPSEA